jgi:hypothetical protein
MHNRNRVVWFGMFLGVSLLGCPPAAKDAKDAKQEAGEESSGSADQPTDEKAEEKESDSAPAPRGGW